MFPNSPDTAGSSFDEDETAASVGALDVISSLRRGGRGGGWSRRRGGEHPLRKHVKPSPGVLARAATVMNGFIEMCGLFLNRSEIRKKLFTTVRGSCK